MFRPPDNLIKTEADCSTSLTGVRGDVEIVGEGERERDVQLAFY